jgi:hypothetical protein
MKISKCICVFTLIFASTFAFAADESATMEKPYLYTSTTAEVTAKVQAINHETRLVTLLRADGSTVTFTASDEARNLDQVMVGDIVHAKYVESISIEVVANEGMEPESHELAAIARTEEGQMPGLAAFDAQVVTATVEDINIEANTFKLKGPDGNVTEYVARNPDNLKKAAVGDLVIITIAESMAISVEMGPVE